MNATQSYFYTFICILFISLGTGSTALANLSQDSTLTVEDISPKPSASQQLNELSFWAGFAFDSYRLWGTTPDATLQSYGLQYNRKLFRWKGAQLEYNLLISAYSKFSYPEFKVGRPRNTLSGVGVTPLGFQVNFFDSATIQPFLNSSGGFMLLDDPFPDQRGEKFNFTFSLGSGLEFMLSNSISLSVGLKYHHISNGDMGQVNPGIDSAVFYSSLTIF